MKTYQVDGVPDSSAGFPGQGNAAERGYKWFSSFSFDLYLEHNMCSLFCGDRRTVFSECLVATDVQFARQSLQKRASDYPVQFVKGRTVVRELVVFHQASILGLILIHDTEYAIMEFFGQMYGLVVVHVGGTGIAYDIFWYSQAGSPVEGTSCARAVRVVVQYMYLVAEEARSFRASMRNERLFFRHFEFEGIKQECLQVTFYFLGFVPWAGKP